MNNKTKMAEQAGAPSGVEGGRRPTGSPEGARSTEVLPKATRRRHSAAYKQKIVREAEGCTEPGQIGALLRREGLYSSQLFKWRKQYQEGALKGLNQARGRRAAKTPSKQEWIRSEKEIARLKEELRKANLIIEVQKKVAALLTQLRSEQESEEKPS